MRERERGGERSPRHVHGSVSIETKRICYKRYCRWISIKPRVRSPLSTLRSPSLSLFLSISFVRPLVIYTPRVSPALAKLERLSIILDSLARLVCRDMCPPKYLDDQIFGQRRLFIRHCIADYFYFIFFLPFIILEWFDRLIKILLCMLIFESRIN